MSDPSRLCEDLTAAWRTSTCILFLPKPSHCSDSWSWILPCSDSEAWTLPSVTCQAANLFSRSISVVGFVQLARLFVVCVRQILTFKKGLQQKGYEVLCAMLFLSCLCLRGSVVCWKVERIQNWFWFLKIYIQRAKNKSESLFWKNDGLIEHVKAQPPMQSHSNPLDPQRYLDPHQIANTRRNQSFLNKPDLGERVKNTSMLIRSKFTHWKCNVFFSNTFCIVLTSFVEICFLVFAHKQTSRVKNVTSTKRQ